MRVVDAARLEKGREKAIKARGLSDRRLYFHGVAAARYVLRKVFRLVEEEAKRAGIDPLAHQALIQIYGSEKGALRVKEVAERLDISPAFSSSLVKMMVKKKGRDTLHKIDEQVQAHVDYFTHGLSAKETEAALSILMFYAGVSLKGRDK